MRNSQERNSFIFLSHTYNNFANIFSFFFGLFYLHDKNELIEFVLFCLLGQFYTAHCTARKRIWIFFFGTHQFMWLTPLPSFIHTYTNTEFQSSWIQFSFFIFYLIEFPFEWLQLLFVFPVLKFVGFYILAIILIFYFPFRYVRHK